MNIFEMSDEEIKKAVDKIFDTYTDEELLKSFIRAGFKVPKESEVENENS